MPSYYLFEVRSQQDAVSSLKLVVVYLSLAPNKRVKSNSPVLAIRNAVCVCVTQKARQNKSQLIIRLKGIRY